MLPIYIFFSMKPPMFTKEKVLMNTCIMDRMAIAMLTKKILLLLVFMYSSIRQFM